MLLCICFCPAVPETAFQQGEKYIHEQDWIANLFIFMDVIIGEVVPVCHA